MRRLVQKQAGRRNDVRNEQERMWEGKGRRKGGMIKIRSRRRKDG